MSSFVNQDEIEAVVTGFELCTTAKDSFKHRDHLTVAVWYLWNNSPDQALIKMRDGLHRFINQHQVNPQKYREDLTIAWIACVQDVMSKRGENLSLVELTNLVHEELGDKQIEFQEDGQVKLN